MDCRPPLHRPAAQSIAQDDASTIETLTGEIGGVGTADDAVDHFDRRRFGLESRLVETAKRESEATVREAAHQNQFIRRIWPEVAQQF